MRVIALRSFGGPDLFAEEEWPVPEPRDDEVRIRVLAASFNPVDRYWRAGLVSDKLPVVLGRDFCGVVDAAGRAVLDLQSGDEVFGVHGSLASNGAYAEYLTLPALLVARRPRKIGVAQAAALPIVGLTAMKCVQSKARFLSGQTALVTGSGGVGEMIVQLLRLAGASNIVTTAGSAGGAAKLEQLGVATDRIVSYRGLEGAALLREALVRNGGRPFSAAFDTAGGALKRLCFEAAEADGQVVSIVEEPVDYNLNLWDSPLVEKSLSFHFEQLSARAVGREAAKLALFRKQLQQLAQLVDDGRLHPPAHEVLAPLSRETVQRAHEVLDRRKGPKLVMRIA
jgi:NADPH:quinone reductase-like Zn-dependent oxidoreductase